MLNSFQIPDLSKICNEYFELRVNQNCYAVGKESLRWLDQLGFFVDEEAHEQFVAAQLPLLAALCYPTCDMTQLRAVTDCLTVVYYGYYHTKSVNDGARQVGLEHALERLRRAMPVLWWARFQAGLENLRASQRPSAEPKLTTSQDRVVEQQLSLKRTSEIFDLAFCMLEYAEDLKLSDDVLASPPVRALRHHALDAVIWMKDIVSYNVQQSKGDTSNLVAVLMKQNQITLQAAINQATASVRECLRKFVELGMSAAVISLNGDTQRYVQGLRDWIAGWAHWVYETEEYFLKNGEEVKAFGWLFLLSKEGEGEGR